jgi:hypothetical protein
VVIDYLPNESINLPVLPGFLKMSDSSKVRMAPLEEFPIYIS